MIPAQATRNRYVALVLHTIAVYFISLRAAPWMFGRWFAWVVPALHISTAVVPADSFLQHLPEISMVPAFMVGYIAVRQSFSLATSSWTVPTVVLFYKMLRFHDPYSSVLTGQMSPFRYFFEIQKVMPTFANPLASDPVRVVAQMTVTAPFYAGVAYAMGALLAKHQVAEKVFHFQSEMPEPVNVSEEPPQPQ